MLVIEVGCSLVVMIMVVGVSSEGDMVVVRWYWSCLGIEWRYEEWMNKKIEDG